MMYSCNDSNDLFHTFLTLTCPSAYYMLYRNMSIYCNTLGAIYRYGKIQYRHSSNDYSLHNWSTMLPLVCLILGSILHLLEFQYDTTLEQLESNFGVGPSLIPRPMACILKYDAGTFLNMHLLASFVCTFPKRFCSFLPELHLDFWSFDSVSQSFVCGITSQLNIPVPLSSEESSPAIS